MRTRRSYKCANPDCTVLISRHVCCSYACAWAIKSTKVEHKCEYVPCNSMTKNDRFCSRSCANYARAGSTKIPGEVELFSCVVCSKSSTNKKYCCQEHDNLKKLRDKVNKALSTGEMPKSSTGCKKIIREVRGWKCEIDGCGISEWMGQEIGLILDHIDGHADNHTYNNLRLVCGNCDMQLPTYKSKNRGNGRHARRERYANGQSY